MATTFPELQTSKSFEKQFQKMLPKIAIHVRQNFETIRSKIIQGREDWDEMFRVVCFTDSKVEASDEILMWSHYANHHKGYRLALSFPALKTSRYAIEEVAYQKERVPVSLFESGNYDNMTDQLYKSIFTKNVAWSYEREHRMIVRPDSCKKTSTAPSMEFFEFEPSWVVGIDFGARCSDDEIIRISTLVRSKFPHALIRQAKFHPTNYSLIYEDVS